MKEKLSPYRSKNTMAGVFIYSLPMEQLRDSSPDNIPTTICLSVVQLEGRLVEIHKLKHIICANHRNDTWVLSVRVDLLHTC